jgi:DNA-directed RNA polymerase specialized sigma subunit
MRGELSSDEALIRKLASRVHFKSYKFVELDDLLQEARLCLLTAQIDEGMSEREIGHFKAMRVRGAMIDWVRAQSWVPRSAYGTGDQYLNSLEEYVGRVTDSEDNADAIDNLVGAGRDPTLDGLRFRDFLWVLQTQPVRTQDAFAMLLNGASSKDIAIKYGVTEGAISRMFSDLQSKVEEALL